MENYQSFLIYLDFNDNFLDICKVSEKIDFFLNHHGQLKLASFSFQDLHFQEKSLHHLSVLVPDKQ